MKRTPEQMAALYKKKLLAQSTRIDRFMRDQLAMQSRLNSALEERDLARGHAAAYQRALQALCDDREKGVRIGRDAVVELTELLRAAGLTPYLHAAGCATWEKKPCDMECGPK